MNQIQHGSDYSFIIGKSNQQSISNILLLHNNQISLFQEEESIRSKYEWLKRYIENSSNDSIKKSLVYQKPILDEMFIKMTKKDYDDWLNATDNLHLSNIGSMPNVGNINFLDKSISLDNKDD